jgi:hypothetical protein
MAASTPVGEIKSGDHRRALVAMRDVLADAMTAAEPAVVAQIAGRLQAVLNDLAALAPEVKQSKTDELRARRENRLTG